MFPEMPWNDAVQKRALLANLEVTGFPPWNVWSRVFLNYNCRSLEIRL
jgi:hypothetical protein